MQRSRHARPAGRHLQQRSTSLTILPKRAPGSRKSKGWQAPLVLATAGSLAAVAFTGGLGAFGNVASTTDVAVSSLTPTVAVNGWGPYANNKSNGEKGSTDGSTLALGGKKFTSGLGVHAGSTLEYQLAGAYTSFASTIGVDDEEGSNGSVVFQVYVDGVRRYESAKLTGRDTGKPVTVDVTGGRTLRLVVTTAGDGTISDHADWASATLKRTASTPGSTPKPTSSPTTATPRPTTTTTTPPKPPTTTTPPTKPSTSVTTPPKPATSTTTPTTTTPPQPTTSTTTAPPSTSGYPNASNSGLTAAQISALQPYTGPTKITTAGTVISGKDITQPLLISAKDVTIQNSRIHGTSSASGDQALIQVAATGAKILNNEIRGDSATDASRAPASGVKIWDSSAQLRGNNMYWIAGDAITVDGTNVVVADNYVHDFTRRDGVHFDGIVYDQDTTSTVLIQHNTVELWVPGLMSGVLGLPDSAPNLTVDNNLLAGGGYAIEGGGGGIKVTNNRFSTKFAGDCGVYGTHAFMGRVGKVNWTGNVWHEKTLAGTSSPVAY